MTKIHHVLSRLVIVVFMSYSVSAVSGEAVNRDSETGIALRGVDVVSYRTLERDPRGSPLAGSETYPVEYKGATWIFATKESADRFRAAPEDFAPAYNGFCANALSVGAGLVATSGQIWEIFGNELHVFFAPRGLERWLNGDWQSYKVDSDKAWAKLKDKE